MHKSFGGERGEGRGREGRSGGEERLNSTEQARAGSTKPGKGQGHLRALSPNPRWEKRNDEELENPENTCALKILLRWIGHIPHSLENTNYEMTGHMLDTGGYKTPKVGHLGGSVS